MTSHLTCVRTDSRIPQFPNIYPASHHCLIMQTIHNIQHISTTWTFFFLLQNNLTLSSLTKSLGVTATSTPKRDALLWSSASLSRRAPVTVQLMRTAHSTNWSEILPAGEDRWYFQDPCTTFRKCKWFTTCFKTISTHRHRNEVSS